MNDESGQIIYGEVNYLPTGITNREFLAGLAMHAFLSSDRTGYYGSKEGRKELAKAAVLHADDLIAELNKQS